MACTGGERAERRREGNTDLAT